MAIELHFSKSDNSSWGFRLTGGAEFDIPLTVVKVTEGSIAENAGLQVDDVIVRINNNSTAGLTHVEAHDAFIAAGSEFYIAVRRGDVAEIQVDEKNNEEVSTIMEGSSQQSVSPLPETPHETSVIRQIEKSSTETSSKFYTTDEQILEAISGETELLPDQNVLGVNFNKVDMTESIVLKAINEQANEIKVDLQNKKWSTFLQKPKTPKIIPKKKEPEGLTEPPYRVIIKKQTKKTAEAANRKVESSPMSVCEEIDETGIQEPEEPLEGYEKDVESQKDELELEQEHEQESVEASSDEKNIMDEEISSYSEEQIEASPSREEKISDTVTTESPVTLEEQLAQVQQQLQALAQLPSAIQVSLDAVTQQLAKIVRGNHKGEEETTVEQNVSSDDEGTAQYVGESMGVLEEHTEASDVEDKSSLEKSDGSYISEDEAAAEEQTHEEIEQDLKISETPEYEHEEHLIEDDQERERIENEKATHQERKLIQMEEFHQRRLEQRPTHPLTPLQRPIILPGGRRWSQPGDALPTPRKPKMTDEKICETIDNYSEVITGRVKGINFLKYQSPPKNLDYLQHSEVFRLVHDMDPPRRGIAARPGKIVSEQDYYTEKSCENSQHTFVEV